MAFTPIDALDAFLAVARDPQRSRFVATSIPADKTRSPSIGRGAM